MRFLSFRESHFCISDHLYSSVDTKTALYGSLAHSCAAQADQMRSGAKSLTDVTRKSPDISSLAANNSERQDHRSLIKVCDPNGVNDQHFGLKFYIVTFACHLIGPFAIDLTC